MLDKAPKGIADGWTISWLHFYSLQKNLSSSTVSSLGVALVIAFAVMLLTSLNWVISVYAILTIIGILATTVGSLVFVGWQLNVLESIVISVAVGLSVDFTLHYAVAYNVSPKKGQVEQVKHALGHVGPAVTLAAMTTFIAGKPSCCQRFFIQNYGKLKRILGGNFCGGERASWQKRKGQISVK